MRHLQIADIRRWLILAVVALPSAIALVGCGSDAGGTATAPKSTVAKPSLATDPAREGEVLVQGDLSPKTDGPFAFDGRYEIRFEQYDPTDPGVRFADQIPFVADLDKREGVPAIHLFKAAAARGHATKELHGRYWVDVSFGDFPYVVRFTPAG